MNESGIPKSIPEGHRDLKEEVQKLVIFLQKSIDRSAKRRAFQLKTHSKKVTQARPDES
jgi:hypothetical protein